VSLVLADVNILAAALHPLAGRHEQARTWLDETVNGRDELAVVPATLIGAIRICTSSRIFDPPASTKLARRFVTALRRAPGSRVLPANERVWERFDRLLAEDRQARGNLVPDAWLAALAIAHGARLATQDRGMARWPGLDWFDPTAG